MGYSIVRKIKVLKTVGDDCKGLKKYSKPIKIFKENKRFNVTQTIAYFNDVQYRGHALSIIQLDEHAEKKPSKRFAKVTSKDVHWEWIVHQKLTEINVGKVADGSRIRWKQEDLFNSLQCREFAIRHDFNRAPASQGIRLYLILIAYAISSILAYSRFGKAILTKGHSLIFIMKQMYDDIVYLSSSIFEDYHAVQLRFGGKDPP
jgi:nicotinic acid phosphoribosyltransferase